MAGLRNSGVDTSAWYLPGVAGTELVQAFANARYDPNELFGGNLPAAEIVNWQLLIAYQGLDVGFLAARSFEDGGTLRVTAAELFDNPDNAVFVPLVNRFPLGTVNMQTYKADTEGTTYYMPPRIILRYTPPAGRSAVSFALNELDRVNGGGFVTGVGALNTFPGDGSTGIVYYGLPVTGPPINIMEAGNSTITVTLDDASTDTIQFGYEVRSPAALPP